jgi:aminomethyltransferase
MYVRLMEPIVEIPSEVQTGPLHARQLALGATFYEDMGWLWTASFGDPVAEYWSVRQNAGLWDVSALVKWRFSGPDALSVLDRLFTRKVASLEPGTVRYGAILDERGSMLDEGTVFVLDRSEGWFLGNDEREPFGSHLRRNASGMDVSIENITSSTANISVQGPRSFRAISSVASVDPSGLRWFQLTDDIELGGVPGVLSRTGFSGELGYEFFFDREWFGRARRLWDQLLAAGADPIGLDAVELLRVEAGLLVQHEDYWPGRTDPYELSLDRVIELDHEFVGRDVCIGTAQHPPRRFVTLVFVGDEAPAPGSEVRSDGVVIGDVRSVAQSPRFGPIALAVVTSDNSGRGTKVEAGGLPATIEPVPIDDPGKERPRSDPRYPLKFH